VPPSSPLFLATPHEEIRGDLPAHEAARELRDRFEAVLLLLGRNEGTLSFADLENVARDRELPADLRRAAATVVETPDLFRRLACNRGALAKSDLESSLLALFLAPNALFGAEHEAQFKNWAMKQVETNPHVGKVFRALIELMRSEARPKTVGALLEHAHRVARESLARDPLFPKDPRAAGHAIMLAAFVGLAAHSLHSNKGEVTCLFPRYIPDGRPGEAGFDKCWHLLNQAMFSFVHLFDRTYGTGDVARDFERAVEQADEHDAARYVAAAYERTRGACGALLPGTLPGPIGEPTIHFAPPRWESDREQLAYDLAVRIGDAHEYSPDFGDPKLIGSNADRCDPFAQIDATFDVCSSLRDPGVARDLTANRTGAWLGVMSFRDPSAFQKLPHDDGDCAAFQTFAPGRKVPARDYLALELAQLAVARDPALDANDAFARARSEVDGLGVPAAKERLISELRDLVDRLNETDREKLARYYATFSIRHLQFGWRVAIEGEERNWRPHVDFGRGIPREMMMEHFLRRIHATAEAFDQA
jgi:hypothetical protein